MLKSILEEALESNYSVAELLVIKEVEKKIKEVNKIFGITLPEIKIYFDIKGCCAGRAKRINNVYSIHFNHELVHNKSIKKILYNTIPHELAHIICFYSETDYKHGKHWKLVCKMLGGTGEIYHTEEVTPARKIKRYNYQAANGEIVIVTSIRHKKIQEGKRYITKKGYEIIPDSYELLTS